MTDLRTAATVLILREDPFEVLMVRRSARGAFPSALVFPGGVVETADYGTEWDAVVTGDADLTAEQRAIRIAAIRETWEEVGVVVAHHGTLGAGDRSTPLRDALGDGTLALDELQHFGHWITPVGEPRRFDTRFYLVRAPEELDAVVDGSETIDLQWIAPQDAVDRSASGDQPLLPVTQLNLARLAESGSIAEAFAVARDRPRFVVEPMIHDVDGTQRISIPAEAGYPAGPQNP